MKVMVWVTQTNVELLEKGEIIQYWLREPANALDVVQVQISYDEFIRLRDNQPEHYITRDHMRFVNYSGTHRDYMDDGYGVED